MSPEPVVLSWSGGKDSSLALAALRSDPRYEVVGLLTSITRGYDRVSIHGVRRELVEAQARMLRLPLHEVVLQPSSSNEAYEAAFAGRAFDVGLLAELPPSVDPCGERGEFHTFVSAGPIFDAEIPIEVGEVVLREGRFAFCDLLSTDQRPGTVEIGPSRSTPL